MQDNCYDKYYYAPLIFPLNVNKFLSKLFREMIDIWES